MKQLQKPRWIAGCCALLVGAGCGDDGGSLLDAGADGSPSVDSSTNVDSGNGGPDLGMSGEHPTAAEISRAAVVFASCVPDDGPSSFMRNYYFQSTEPDYLPIEADMIRCLANTGGGCDAVETCMGITIDDGGPCSESCDGNTFTVCDDELRFRIDCGLYGATCDADEGCLLGPLGEECDYDTFEASCEDGRPSYCSGGTVSLGVPCDELGLSCVLDDSFGSDAYCIGGEGTCDGESQSSNGYELRVGTCVSDEQLQVCANDGLHTVTCSDFHPSLSCQTTSDGSFCARGNACDTYCDRSNPDCDNDPFASREVTCEGTEVVLCDMGEIVRIDCADLGFTGCSRFGCTG